MAVLNSCTNKKITCTYPKRQLSYINNEENVGDHKATDPKSYEIRQRVWKCFQMCPLNV